MGHECGIVDYELIRDNGTKAIVFYCVATNCNWPLILTAYYYYCYCYCCIFSCRNLLHFDLLSKSTNQKLLVMLCQFLQTSCTASEIGAALQLAYSIASNTCTHCSLGKYMEEMMDMFN